MRDFHKSMPTAEPFEVYIDKLLRTHYALVVRKAHHFIMLIAKTYGSKMPVNSMGHRFSRILMTWRLRKGFSKVPKASAINTVPPAAQKTLGFTFTLDTHHSAGLKPYK